MKKLCNFFEYLTIILFVLFLSWSTCMLICLFTLVDIPLWLDSIVIFFGFTTIISSGITMSIYEKPSRTDGDTRTTKEHAYCSVCKSCLHTNEYPDNFPAKYKICCNCKRTADIIYKENHKEIYNKIIELKELIPDTDAEAYLNWSESYLENKEKFDDVFIVKNNKEEIEEWETLKY